MCMSRGKYFKPWQVIHKIIEWNFSQFKFNTLRVTLTQKIITYRLSKMRWSLTCVSVSVLLSLSLSLCDTSEKQWHFRRNLPNFFWSTGNSEAYMVFFRSIFNFQLDLWKCFWLSYFLCNFCIFRQLMIELLLSVTIMEMYHDNILAYFPSMLSYYLEEYIFPEKILHSILQEQQKLK